MKKLTQKKRAECRNNIIAYVVAAVFAVLTFVPIIIAGTTEDEAVKSAALIFVGALWVLFGGIIVFVAKKGGCGMIREGWSVGCTLGGLRWMSKRDETVSICVLGILVAVLGAALVVFMLVR